VFVLKERKGENTASGVLSSPGSLIEEFNFESANDVHFFVSGCGAQLEESTYWEFTWDEQNYRTNDIAGNLSDFKPRG